jgi:hypothetical protein
MQLGGDTWDWDEVEEFCPYLVFKEDFCALHFKAGVKDFQWNLLV